MSSGIAQRVRAVLERDPVRRVPLILGGANARAFAQTLNRPASVIDRIEDLVGVARELAHVRPR